MWQVEEAADDNSEITQCAGTHRTDCLKMVQKLSIDAIDVAEKKLAKTASEAMSERLNPHRKALDEKGTWLIGFYDREFCFIRVIVCLHG